MKPKEKVQYSPKDVAALTDKSEQTIRRQISEGTIKSVKQGGSRVIPHDSLIRYLGHDPFKPSSD
jgi:excisionase family DNA binding protein